MVDFKATLKARMDKATQASAASFRPTPSRKKTPKEPEPPPPSPEDVIPDVAQAFLVRQLASRIGALNLQISKLTAEQKPIAERLKTVLSPLGKMKLQVGDYRLNYYKAPRKTIMGTLLLDAGVSPKVIAACTRVSDGWTLRVGSPDDNEEEG